FHFGIDATGEIWITSDFDLAAASFKQVEKASAELISEMTRRKRPKVKALVGANLAGDVTTWVRISEIHFEHGGWTDPSECPVALRKKRASQVIVQQRPFEFRTGHPIADTSYDTAQVEAFGLRFGSCEQP